LYNVRRSNFKGHATIEPELDLVDLDDQFTHELSLDDKHDVKASLNIFHLDAQFAEHEAQYAEVRKEILGDSDDDDESDADGEYETDSDDDGGDGGGGGGGAGSALTSADEQQQKRLAAMSGGGGGGGGGGGAFGGFGRQNECYAFRDGHCARGDSCRFSHDKAPVVAGNAGMLMTQDPAEAVKTRKRQIYLTVMSSMSFEECAHKLMQVQIPDGQEVSCAFHAPLRVLVFRRCYNVHFK
jgi:hypothetical protein